MAYLMVTLLLVLSFGAYVVRTSLDREFREREHGPSSFAEFIALLDEEQYLNLRLFSLNSLEKKQKIELGDRSAALRAMRQQQSVYDADFDEAMSSFRVAYLDYLSDIFTDRSIRQMEFNLAKLGVASNSPRYLAVLKTIGENVEFAPNVEEAQKDNFNRYIENLISKRTEIYRLDEDIRQHIAQTDAQISLNEQDKHEMDAEIVYLMDRMSTISSLIDDNDRSRFYFSYFLFDDKKENSDDPSKYYSSLHSKSDGLIMSLMRTIFSIHIVIIVMCVSLLSGILGALVAFTRRSLKSDEDVSLTKLFVDLAEGAVASIAVFLLVGAGLLVLTNGTTSSGGAIETMSPYMLCLLGFVSGFLAEDAFGRIEKEGKKIFGAAG
jgi:hypothetical protein